MTANELQCFNLGCQMKFKAEENHSDSCQYHPQKPVFHDAYKCWPCCNKRSTDFTTFLQMKGCINGRHNPEKPLEPEKAIVNSTFEESCRVSEVRPIETLPRPSLVTPTTRLHASITPSLKQVLLKEVDEKTNNATDDEKIVDGFTGIRVGESCKNNSCKQSYEGDHSDLTLCQHHPGFPVFHEGLKYWTCCQKRTTEFDIFLAQEGCTTGRHLWIKKGAKKVSACRYDWHQTATHVFVTVYAKNPDPALTHVDANPVRLDAQVVFAGDNEFGLKFELKGIIDVTESSVILAPSKVEIKLRKAEPHTWPRLNQLSDVSVNGAEDTDDLKEIDLDNDIAELEPVDLSDI